jgi:transcriptional regulator with XRE-family HTH domain
MFATGLGGMRQAVSKASKAKKKQSMAGRRKIKQHPMMRIWRARLGNEVLKRRLEKKIGQAQFAAQIGISRQQLSIIENGGRSYTIEPLLRVLAGVDADPIKGLVSMVKEWNNFDEATIEAVRVVVEMYSDSRRQLVKPVIDSWKESSSGTKRPSSPPKKGN